jgi:hypothetical protein
MNAAKQNNNSYHLTNVSNEGRVRTLYPDVELYMPIKMLQIPRNFSCRLNDILKICEMINAGQITDPIIVNEDNLIIDGKKRYYAFKRLGYERVNVVRKMNTSNDLNGNEYSVLKNCS